MDFFLSVSFLSILLPNNRTPIFPPMKVYIFNSEYFHIFFKELSKIRDDSWMPQASNTSDQ